jgi:hypothetical protein
MAVGEQIEVEESVNEFQNLKTLAEALMILTGSSGVRLISAQEARAILARYGWIDADKPAEKTTSGDGLKA